METRSIKSGFQFINYKIDRINFDVVPKVNYLINNDKPEYKIGFGFRNTEKFKDKEAIYYVGGLGVFLTITQDNEPAASGEFSISGIFTTDDEFDENTEQNLAKYQIPAILFPYLRSAVTNILASSGFGNIILPLVNIQATAQGSEVKIVDHTLET